LRRIVDVIAVVCVTGAALGIAVSISRRSTLQGDAETTADELRRFQSEINLRAATDAGDGTTLHWPPTVDPAWFKGKPPRNELLSRDRPWLEIAAPEQAHLRHPELRIAIDRSLASFWYNPAQGIIRARVPPLLSDAETLSLYNTVNGARLESLYFIEPPPGSTPSPVPAALPPESAVAGAHDPGA
jgi:hypothetical protein